MPSGRYVRPFCGKRVNDTVLILSEDESSDCLFIFENLDGNGYAYLRHMDSGKYVHPYRGFRKPWNNTNLVIYENFHKACLFKHFPDQNMIQHVGGKYVKPYKNNSEENAKVVLHESFQEDCFKIRYQERKSSIIECKKEEKVEIR